MRVKVAFLAALLVWPGTAAFASELSPDLRSLIERYQAHRRVAVGYLRTQNSDLGTVEIERLRETLVSDRKRLSPSTLTDIALAAAVVRTEALVADSLRAADEGNIGRSLAFLEDARKPIDAWRQANGIRLFSDCIAEISTAYKPFDGHRSDAPDLADAAIGKRLIAAVTELVAVLDRCEREAAEDMQKEPEFRRLFDGMRASLRQMPGAVSARNGALLHRLLIEQRSFEQLLSFRFG
jgi:hypothetical protein